MSSISQKLAPYLFLIISSVVILGANPFAGETVAPTDILTNQPGWQNLDIRVPTRHPARTDILDARMPRWLHAKQELRNGNLPIWNPSPINGIPGMQWLPAAIITPAFAVFASIEDNATGYYFAMLTNLVIAAIGMYLLLLSMTKHRLAAIFGAMVFAYSGFHAAWFFWAHVTTSIWIPWLLWLSYNYLTNHKLVYLPWLSIVAALMIFGGFPSIAVYGFMAMAILFAVHTPWQQSIATVTRQAVHLGLAIVMAFLISSFATHSLYEMLQFTQSMETRHGGTPLRSHHILNYIKPIFRDYADVERSTYIGVLPLLFLTLSILLLIWRKSSTNLIYAIVLLALSTLIAFAILPKGLITIIPTFSSNNWGRMTVLSALAFAVISAELICLLLRSEIGKQKSKLIGSLVVLLIVIQLFDMRWFFREFNGPVPAESFFASTPTIEYLQENLRPMQSTIADRSYMVSGIFNNYGIPEWLAHGFKTQSERALLESKLAPNAHRSRTAAAVYCEDIFLDSNILNLLAIKYIACHKPISTGGMQRTVLATSGPKAKASGLITPEKPLIQHFALPKVLQFDVISLKLATHGRAKGHADLKLRLFHDNQLLAESLVESTTITDNSWVEFFFPRMIELETQNNRLELHAEATEQKGKLSAWLYPIQADDVFIEHNGNHQSAMMAAKFFRIIQLPDSIVSHRIEANLVLLENNNVIGSGYTLPSLDEDLQPDFSQVNLLAGSATSYELEYTGREPAWMVLPIRYYPYWQATIDNQPVEVETFMDMLPAIKVTPGAKVSYRYEPRPFYLLSLLSLASLGLVLFLTYRYRKQ
ncbi:MAG: hypothetical protein JAZ20_00265 [Candidatus Thiodiazotropha weberae]|nr:hypothetical protein [Candidatus Thiodiazotropha lotti]MCG8018835.1 hypothetical protein [Candidatus Thiodiazotropha lotti]MCW4205994.1 hypothetical protein [Candidatus Thiodiazotropha lotti]MCW4215136.1 hypothetical protein [Candidatus Thiodiazotropha lotti]